MNPENLQAAGRAGHANLDLAIEASGTPQRRVEDLGDVGRAEDDHLSPRDEAVHQPKQLRDDALFHLADHFGALGRHGVDLVDEDDRRGVPGRLFEHVAELGLALPVELAHDLGAVEVDEVHPALGGDRPRKQGLSGPGRAVEQHPLRRQDAEPLEDARVLERQLDDLADALQLALEAADVLVRNAGRLHRPVVPLDDPDIGALVDHDRPGGERPHDLEIDGLRERRDADDAARDDRDAFQIFDDAFRRDGRLIDPPPRYASLTLTAVPCSTRVIETGSWSPPPQLLRTVPSICTMSCSPVSSRAARATATMRPVIWSTSPGRAPMRTMSAGDRRAIARPMSSTRASATRRVTLAANSVFPSLIGVSGMRPRESAGIGRRHRVFGHVADHDGRPESFALVSKRS